jgi:tetratricopeptide (TPR) repeat protein
MPQRPRLPDDLAALAADERSRWGEPPTAEQLLAYHAGELPEVEAERIRELLAVDPEWASIYLELVRSSDTESVAAEEPAGSAADAEVDEAWHRFSAKLDQEAAPASHPRDETARVPPRRRRRWGPLLLAAMVVLGLGFGWFLLDRTGSDNSPGGGYHVVELSAEPFRGPTEIPDDVATIEFRIDLSDLDDPPEKVRVEISDASGKPIRNEEMRVEPGAKLTVRVGLEDFEPDRIYRLVVLSADPSDDRPPLRKRAFIVVHAATNRAGLDAQPTLPLAVGGLKDDDRCERLETELNRTGAAFERGEYETAAARYPDLLEASLADPRCPLQAARACNGLSALANRKSRLIESLDLLRRGFEALDAAEASDAPAADTDSVRGTLEYNRGTTFFRLGWLEEARDAADRLLAVRRRAAGAAAVDLARAHLLSARAHRGLGDSRRATAEVREGLDLLGSEEPKVRASLWQEQARLDLEAERFPAANENLGRALAALDGLKEPVARANVVVDLAEVEMRRGNWKKCLQRVDETLEQSAAGSPDLNLEAQARYLRSVALSGLGKIEEAILSEDAALAMLEASRGLWRDLGLRFFAQRHKHSRHRLDLAVAAGHPEDAWSVFENTRARGLLESLRRHPAESSLDAEQSQGEEEAQRRRALLIEAIRRLDAWDPDTGQEGRNRLAAHMRTRRRELDQLLADQFLAAGRALPQLVEPGQAREMLDADSLGLTFASGTERIYLLVFAPGRELELLTLPVDRQRIAELGGDLLRSLEPEAAQEVRARFEPIVGELSRHLIGLLGDRLDGFRRLAIVADEPLEGLPFDGLRDPRSGKRLIASHQISILPSFSALRSLQSRAAACPPAESGLLAMADPIFSSEDPRWPPAAPDPRSRDEALTLPRLPASAAEAQSIAAFYPPQPSVLVGRDANLERFLAEAPKHRVIHLASHGRTDAKMPERSKIALSCIDEDDRPVETCDLYFADIVGNLDLCGQIVVLSACETAAGESIAGEGVLGLPRAFLRAGASTVVASHWRVPDEPTARLMTAFHRYLAEDGDPAGALRQAKLDMIAAGDPPSTWAAFTLLGDWHLEALPSTFSSASGPINRKPR